ncbi:hypothetical protein Nepgr_031527 [Nepenthes gracilis]|uniref:Uncharacterized protein n=1 Tax=Nepenthes gracilis TaxID=150966 RepID=A0AAD3Y763_NEPGR|nr:hypothetical protein Nepgr_031527 [Nepenthes gracilis]
MVSGFKSAIALLYLLHPSSANNHHCHNRRVLPYPLFPPGSSTCPATKLLTATFPALSPTTTQLSLLLNYRQIHFSLPTPAPSPPLPSPPQSASTTTSFPTFQSNISSLVLPQVLFLSHFPVSSN